MSEQSSTLPGAFSTVISDLADLMQKEVRLARAELGEKLSITLRAGIWMSAAGVLAIVALLLVVQARVDLLEELLGELFAFVEQLQKLFCAGFFAHDRTVAAM